MKYYEFELGRAADILTRDLLKLKSEETFDKDAYIVDLEKLVNDER